MFETTMVQVAMIGKLSYSAFQDAVWHTKH
jgi:hypothetical protein